MLTPATEMSQGARPTGLAKPGRLKRTAEKCARETGMGNLVQRVWKKPRITFHPSTSRDRKVGGRAWTAGLLKSSQGQVAGNPIQGAHKSERFFQDTVN